MSNPYIQQVEATGVKGPAFSHKLGSLVAIRGRNFTGKTRIIEAIRFGLLGHIPEIGKKPQDAMALCDGSRLEVKLTLSNDNWATKTLTRSSGKVSFTEALAPGSASWDEFKDVPLLDQAHYFSLTDSKRTEYLFSRLALAEYSKDKIKLRLQRATTECGTGDAILEAVNKALALVFVGTLWDSNLPAAINGALDDVKQTLSDQNKRAKETIGAVRTLTDLKLREKEVSADNLPELAKEDAALLTAQGELAGQLNAVKTKLENIETNRTRHDSVTALLGKLAPKEELDAKLNAACTKVDELKAEMAEPTALLALQPIIEEGKKARAEQSSIKASILQYGSEKARHSAVIDRIKVEIEKINALECCPTCKAQGDGWRDGVLKTLKVNLSSHQTDLAGCEGVLTEAAKRLEGVDATLGKIEARYLGAKAQHDSYNSRLEALKSAESQVVAIKAGMENSEKLREAYNTQLAQLGGWSAEEAARLSTERFDIEAKLEDLRLKRLALQGRRDAFNRLQHDILRAAQAKEEHEGFIAYATVLKAVQKELKAIQTEMVDASFGAVLTIANKITEGILKSPLSFKDGEVGRFDPPGTQDHFVPHYAFSGTEQAVTFAGIAAGLSARAPMRVLVLDEIGRLDRFNRTRLLENLVKCAQEGHLDQVIIAGTEDSLAEVSANFQVIETV